MAKSLPNRSDVPKAHTWDLEALFKTDKAWETAFASIDADLPKIRAFAGRLTESAQTLLAFYKLHDDVAPRLQHVLTYAALKSDQDTTNQKHASMAGRAYGLVARVNEAESFVQPELLATDPAVLAKYMAGEPALAVYAHALDDLGRMRPHVLSHELEAGTGVRQHCAGLPGACAWHAGGCRSDLRTGCHSQR